MKIFDIYYQISVFYLLITLFNLNLPRVALAQNSSETVVPSKVSEIKKPEVELNNRQNLNFIIPPRFAEENKIHPFTTTIFLDRKLINHLNKWESNANYTFGENINRQFHFNGNIKLSGQIEESLSSDNIFQTIQTGNYLQLETIKKERTITTSIKEAQKMLGIEFQLSLTGTCLLSEEEEDDDDEQSCTYTPGIVIDRNSINRDFLLPTRIFLPSNFGDVVLPETLEAIKAPGFQRGTQEQEIGIDLYFPNTGTIPDSERGTSRSILRKEEIKNLPIGSFKQVKQIVQANHKEAVIRRTIRGFNIIIDEDNTLTNSALHLVNFILPDFSPNLTGGENQYNPNINQNLFLAANNIRLPLHSFTIYQTGKGKAQSITKEVKNLNDVPVAKFNSVWLGLSPVIKRSFKQKIYYDILSSPEIIIRAGGEGGEGEGGEGEGGDSKVSLLSVINGQPFSTNNLNNFYTQVYLSFFSQDVDFISSQILKEDTDYFPHLSFSGNITDTSQIFRYYSGTIFSDRIKPYVGADYTKNTANGWNYNFGAIGYLNADREYYSLIKTQISKKFTLSKNLNFSVFSDFYYALDQPTSLTDITFSSTDSSIVIGTNLNWGAFHFGINQNIGGILPSSRKETLNLNVRINLVQYLQISGYYNPIDLNGSRSTYGTTATLKLGKHSNSPSLNFNWKNIDYDLGNNLIQNDNIFTILFKLKN